MLPLLLPLLCGQLGYSPEDTTGTTGNDADPWVPCEKPDPTDYTRRERGLCRLSCTAQWSYAPHRLDCKMLDWDVLLRRSHSRGMFLYRQMSQDSFSKVNSGYADPSDPDVT